MSYRHLLRWLGCVLVLLGLIERGWFLLVAWLGCDFLLLGIAHGQGAHRLFGKREDGTLPLWSWAVFGPLLLYTVAIWHLLRALSREPAHQVVNGQLVVGRRLLGSELHEEFENVVDLTAEFCEPSALRQPPAYRSFPILDGGAPTPEALLAAVTGLRPGRTFVHCAQGHGRTGLFALAMLLYSGSVPSVEEGLRKLQAVRPGIRLNREQRRCIEAYARDVALARASSAR